MVGYFLQQYQLQNPELMLVMMLRKFPRFLILSMSWPMIFMDPGMDLQVIFNFECIKVDWFSRNLIFFFETDIMKENSEKFGWSFTLKIVFDIFWRSIWKAVKFLGLEYILFLNFFIFTDHHAPLFKREHDYYPYNTLTVDYAMQYWHQKGT